MTLRGHAARLIGLSLGTDFVRFWLATTAALFGSSFGLVVIPLVAGLTLRASAGQVALLGFLELAPYLIFGLFVGAWVDRVPKRTLMITSHVLRAATLAVIPAAYSLGILSVGLLYVTSFVFGFLTMLFEVAHQSYLPIVVGDADLLEANGRMQFSRSSAELSGPGAAGAAVQVLAAPLALVANALAFLGAAALIFSMRRREEPAPRPGLLMRDVREGLVFVFHDRVLRAVAGSLSAL
jgi:hypothetical protein